LYDSSITNAIQELESQSDGALTGTINVLRNLLAKAKSREMSLPKYLSLNHDPLYRFHQWQSNLRVLEVTEIKTVPYVPLSHPFVEWLIGTLRREYLDRILFWTTVDLDAKLTEFQNYYNGHRAHAGLEGGLPEPGADGPIHPSISNSTGGEDIVEGCTRLQSPHNP
jgi:hypothetical protein